MKIPSTIKVAHTTYRVRLIAPNLMGENHADIDHASLELRIASDLSPPVQAEKLVHELLHAAYDAWKISPRYGEEKTVELMAPALCTMWADNPKLCAWLTRALKQRREK